MKNQVIYIKLKSSNLILLKLYIFKLKKLLKIKSVIVLPNQIKKLTLLKSPHVHKTSRDQYELKTYNRLLIISLLNIKIINFNYFKKIFLNILKIIPSTITCNLILK